MVPEREEIARIVVCEDDEATLALLVENLVADRYGVEAAPAAADALRLCQYWRPDLLLLDLNLPDASTGGPLTARPACTRPPSS